MTKGLCLDRKYKRASQCGRTPSHFKWCRSVRRRCKIICE